MGFEKDKAASLASHIVVDPARGSGHASGAAMRGDVAHLRTRFTTRGMNYKGYNIAIHEFGHNVEQTISLYDIDYYLLNGVPNTAFTEALAFLFQERDLELLGVDKPGKEKEALSALDILWNSYEIMGVALVDDAMWQWIYDHPDATPAELREAVTGIAKEIWNTYYADVFGVKDQVILAIYSHMVSYPLYLHSYPLGHIVHFQLKEYLKGKDFGKEIERIYSLGSITPDAWIMQAVGQPLSVDPLLKTAEEALAYFK
jgi:oligoendopeptidase F